MASTESPARVIDAVFANLEEPELDKLRFSEDVLKAALGDPDKPEIIFRLTPDQKTELKKALTRRLEAVKQDPLEGKAQTIRSLLFERADESLLEKYQLKLETPEQFDEAADLILAYKKRLARKPARRGGGIGQEENGSNGDEELSEYEEMLKGLTPESVEELQKLYPELMAGAFGPEGMKNMMNFYSVKYMKDQGFDSQTEWEKFQKGFLLFTLPTGLDPETYESLLNEDWQHPRPENAILVEQVQAWQLVTDLLPVKFGPYSQVARLAQHLYPTMGILGSTYVSKLFEAAAKVDQFVGALKASTEDIAERIGEASPDGEQIAALLYAGRRPIVVEGDGQNRVGAFEMGVARSLDVATGYVGEFKKSENGEPIYEYRYDHNGTVEVRVGTLNQVLEGLSVEEKKKACFSEHLNQVWDGNLFKGRLVPGERMNTMTEMMRDEKAKLPFYEDAVTQIETNMKLEDITKIWALHEDGKQLTRDHNLFKLAYKVGYAKAKLAKMGELGFDVGKWRSDLIEMGMPKQEVEAMLIETTKKKLLGSHGFNEEEWRTYLQGLNMPPEDIEILIGDTLQNKVDNFEKSFDTQAKRYAVSKMVQDVVISAYARYPDLGLELAEIFTETALWDVQQWFDHLPELWNKMMTTMPYDEKYAILPAVARKLIQSYIRGILAWKRKDVDPVLVSLYGNPKKATAAWRDPLDASRAPRIPTMIMMDGKVARSMKGKTDVITLPSGDQMSGDDWWLNVSTTIEAVLYTKSDWRVGVMGRMVEANNLVNLAKIDPVKAEAQAISYLDNYIGEYNTLAPQEFPSDRGSAVAKLLSLSSERRACLEMVNFKPLLKAMGYQNLNLSDLDYIGVRGLGKLIEMRSNGHWLVGQVEKWFKYMSKYPGMAVAEGKLLSKVVPILNNAINPLLESFLGGAPERIEGFNADQFGEALAKKLVDIIFAGKRKPGDALKYLDSIGEALGEAMQVIGYMSGGEQRQNVMDVMMLIDGISDKAVMMAEHNWINGTGEHGSSRGYLDLEFENPKQEQEVVGSLRRAGFLVIYPDGTQFSDYDIENLVAHGEIQAELLPTPGLTDAELADRQNRLWERIKELDLKPQKKPYVSWGIQPVFFAKGHFNKDGSWTPETEQGEGFGDYAHRGKEVLGTVFLLEYLMDKLLLTEHDTKAVLAEIAQFKDKAEGEQLAPQIDMIWNIYKDKRQEYERLALAS